MYWAAALSAHWERRDDVARQGSVYKYSALYSALIHPLEHAGKRRKRYTGRYFWITCHFRRTDRGDDESSKRNFHEPSTGRLAVCRSVYLGHGGAERSTGSAVTMWFNRDPCISIFNIQRLFTGPLQWGRPSAHWRCTAFALVMINVHLQSPVQNDTALLPSRIMPLVLSPRPDAQQLSES